MPKLTFVEPSGEEHVVEGAIGDSVMQAALFNGVTGIDADCGGACTCATCHVHVDADWFEKVGPPDEFEQDLLDGEDDVAPTSRLSCQIEVTEALDGLRVRVPER